MAGIKLKASKKIKKNPPKRPKVNYWGAYSATSPYKGGSIKQDHKDRANAIRPDIQKLPGASMRITKKKAKKK